MVHIRQDKHCMVHHNGDRMRLMHTASCSKTHLDTVGGRVTNAIFTEFCSRSQLKTLHLATVPYRGLKSRSATCSGISCYRTPIPAPCRNRTATTCSSVGWKRGSRSLGGCSRCSLNHISKRGKRTRSRTHATISLNLFAEYVHACILTTTTVFCSKTNPNVSWAKKSTCTGTFHSKALLPASATRDGIL